MKRTIEEGFIKLGLISNRDQLIRINSVYGGSINSCYKVDLHERSYFTKLNSSFNAKDFFECEEKGLQMLKNNSSILIPEVFGLFNSSDSSMLVMEYIEEGAEQTSSYEEFGHLLAGLHARSNDYFGLDHNNYIGSLPQSNKPKNRWIEFFIEERLERQYKLAKDNSIINEDLGEDLNKLYKVLEDLIPEEIPALLHGDLWSGNSHYNSKGKPVIYDPAIYYGHREVDIAMMHLFGGFDRRLFDAYNEVNPLKKGWEERVDLFNLYPLFVHINLFGGGYLSRFKSVLRKYV